MAAVEHDVEKSISVPILIDDNVVLDFCPRIPDKNWIVINVENNDIIMVWNVLTVSCGKLKTTKINVCFIIF